tara:strand:+ start:13995 stop:14810 length:816 start_codon:yes stop_codon:yes gene_type:complete
MIGRIFLITALVLGAFLMLVPFFWMLSLSFKDSAEIFSPVLDFFPAHLSLDNYITAFTKVDLGRFLFNGVVVCAGILVFQLLFSVPCAYALTQRRFRGRQVIFGLVLAGLLVPFHVTAIPLFLALAKLNLLDTYTALIVPFVTSMFGIFLFRQAFAALSPDLFDAARLDGLSETAIVWRIALPLVLPAATAFGIFSVVAHWNDLFWNLIVTSDPQLATPPRGILYFRDRESGSDIGPLMAATVIVIAPMIVGFLMAQRRFIQGLATGGLKG